MFNNAEILPPDVELFYERSTMCPVGLEKCVRFVSLSPGGGAVLRCDVIVDTPASLSIATTTREVYVEEAAELFELVAHDVEGNQFSSLSGLAFEWTVENTNGQSVVEIMPFTESDYDSTSVSVHGCWFITRLDESLIMLLFLSLTDITDIF